MSDLCPCGQPLHYRDPVQRALVEAIVAVKGPLVEITTPEGSWMVSRHYVALHGLLATELPELAKKFGWELVGPGKNDPQLLQDILEANFESIEIVLYAFDEKTWLLSAKANKLEIGVRWEKGRGFQLSTWEDGKLTYQPFFTDLSLTALRVTHLLGGPTK